MDKKIVNVYENNLNIPNFNSFKSFDDFTSFLENESFKRYYSLYILNTKSEKEYNEFESAHAKNTGEVFNYTSSEYPLFVWQGIVGNEVIVEPAYFKNHKDEIINTLKDLFYKRNGIVNGIVDKTKYGEFGTLNIPDYLFSIDELKILMLNNQNSYFNILHNTNLESIDINELANFAKTNHIDLGYNNNVIYEDTIFGKSKRYWAKKQVIDVNDSITKDELFKLFKCQGEGGFMRIQLDDSLANADEVYNTLYEVLNSPDCTQKPYINIFTAYSYKVYKSSLINLKDKSRIRIRPSTSFSNLEEDRFIKFNEKLNELIKPIKESNLSPYEKYLGAYNITKKFKEYAAEPPGEGYGKSRDLNEILDNKYMTCMGFSNMLYDLCQRLDIPVARYITDVIHDPFKIEKELIGEEVILNNPHSGHERNLVHIKDEKYGIDGVYYADPTWDNNLDKDTYFYSNMVYDESTNSYLLTKLSLFDFLLDIKNDEDFKEKASYLLTHYNRSESDNDKCGIAYISIKPDNYLYSAMCVIVKELYPDDYYEFRKENDSLYKDDISTVLTNYYHEFKDTFNKPISFETTLQAAKEVQKNNGLSENELINWEKETRESYYSDKEFNFPPDMWEVTTRTLENSESEKKTSHAK